MRFQNIAESEVSKQAKDGFKKLFLTSQRETLF